MPTRRNASSRTLFQIIVISLIPTLLTACGGGGGGDDDTAPPAPTTYSIGGTVSGLSNGASVTLQNNGGNALTINAAGPFSFSTELASGAGYNVTVSTQPSGQTCTASNSSGTVSNADVSTVAITCSTLINPNGATVLSPTHKPTLVGVVIDSPVINLHYDAPVLDGTTNPQGQFDYLPGDLIKFKVGDVELPPVVGRPVITILDFAATTDINNTVVVNIARFLQSLDSDGDASNGITISAQAHAAATGHTLDFSSVGFDAAANPIIAAAGGTNTSLISAGTAIANLQAGLQSASKQNPLVGTWATGSGASLQTFIFMEDGSAYLLDAGCGGSATAVFALYSIDISSSTLNVFPIGSAVVGSSSCPLPLSTPGPFSISGANLSLYGKSWSPVIPVNGSLAGTYAGGNLSLAAAGKSAFHVFLDSGQYIELDDCVDHAAIEWGAYAWNSSTNALTVSSTHSSDASCITTGSMTTPLTATLDFLAPGALASTLQITVMDSTDEDSYNFNLLAPDATTGSLVGMWDTGDVLNGGLLVFTAHGEVFTDWDCSATPTNPNAPPREIGTYAWDSATNNAVVTITNDNNGNCGLSAIAPSITKLQVTGNILHITTGNEPISVMRYTGAGVQDFWQRIANGTTAAMSAVFFSPVGSSFEGYAPTPWLFATDCPFGSVEDTSFTGFSSNVWTVDNDIPGCGLPAAFGPNYQLQGDTLTIDGLGTFTRNR